MAEISPLSLPPLPVLNDAPIGHLNDDHLDLEHWARVVARVALTMKGPFTIGVFGRWGTGKTSILNIARKKIAEANNENVYTVFFDAWKYEQEETPLIPLVATIIRALNQSSHGGRAAALVDALRSLLYGFSIKAKTHAPLLGDISLTLDPQKAIDRYQNLRTEWMEKAVDNTLFFNVFESLRETTEKTDKRIVIFIDDLDRCMPKRALHLLESLKLVFDHPSFIFILGLDHTVLESHLEKRFQEVSLKGHGKHYLEKLIQLPVWIPSQRTRFDELAKHLLSSEPFKVHWKNVDEKIKLLGAASKFNPRRLVRFLNDLLVDKELYSSLHSGKEFPLDAFIVDRGLRHQSRSLLRTLLEESKLCQDLEKFQHERQILEYAKQQMWAEDQKEPLSEATRSALSELQMSQSIRELLVSTVGRKWLAQEQLRQNVDEFIIMRDPKESEPTRDSERLRWAQKQVEEALSRLKPENTKMALTACLNLRAMEPSMDTATRRRTCVALNNLMTSKQKETVRLQVEVTREKLACAEFSAVKNE